MTLHVNCDHQCPECEAFYIPYDEKIPCPKCGLIEPDRFDYIAQAADSLRFNKAGGSYTPGAWYVGSLGDHVLNLLFPLFDSYVDEEPGEFQPFAANFLGRMGWGDQAYLEEHILGIAVRLHETLSSD